MHPPKPESTRGRFGIRARLLTLLLPGVLALLALDSWNDYHALRALVQDAYDQSMLEPVNALSNSIDLAADGSLRLNTPFSVQAMFEATRPQHKHLYVGLTPLPDGAVGSPRTTSEVTLLGEPDLPRPPVRPDDNGPAVWYDAVYRGYPVRVVALQRTALDGQARPYRLLIQAAEGTGPRLQAQADSLRQEILRDIRMVGLMILLVWLGVTWSLQPLERLRKSLLQSQADDLKPLDTRGVPHEVAPLVEAVNQHIASYRNLLDQQSQFLADASHQLRTPLAIMLTQAGVALREKDPAQVHETLRAIVTQISRSRRLCEQLLSLAHASDSAAPADVPAIVDLNTIARDVVLQYLALAHEKNQDLGWIDAREEQPAPSARAEDAADDAASVAPVLAVGAELHEAIANLVHNAIVYTPPGGHITVRVSAQDGMALAEVHDDGPGIAKARRAEVFERFRQVGQGAEKNPHGAGLGLSIARAYARRHGGDIELADLSTPGSTGLRAILRLPLASRHQG